MLDPIKVSFIELSLQYQALTFGEFTLKSGRVSPYFFNMGKFNDGFALQLVGQCYAQTLLANNVVVKHLFGPAYKGIPLATATACALAQKNVNVAVTFNRKEAKDHGEGGILIGAPLQGKTVIIDDVITAGTAFKEARSQIIAEGGEVTAVVIGLDRCELYSTSALTEISTVPVYSIITLFDLINYLQQNNADSAAQKLQNYHANL